MKSIFDSAKFKLTALYLAIIMTVTISFSVFIFSGVNIATEHALETQRLKLYKQILQVPPEFRSQVVIDSYKTEALLEIRETVLRALIIINTCIFLVSGTAGFYLAGRTLKPIEEMLKKQKRFLSDAAHELKTPLTAIKTDIEVTLRDKNLDLHESKKTLERTVEEIDNLSALASSLLKSSKYKDSDLRKNIQEVKLDELSKKVISKFKGRAGQKNIDIVEELGPVKVKADPIDLDHLLMNLIDNAIKYSDKNSNVFVTVSKNKNVAEIKIKDQGIGISKKDLSQIFEPFYRSDKSRNRTKAEGYGLGLAISKDIVEFYGGNIKVESQIGKGSIFIALLPISI